MKQHIVFNGAYYYALPVGSRSTYWGTILQFRTKAGDLFVDSRYYRTFPTRLEAYRYMFFNIKNLLSWYGSRRICYSYPKLTRIMLKHFPEDFL